MWNDRGAAFKHVRSAPHTCITISIVRGQAAGWCAPSAECSTDMYGYVLYL